MKYDFSALSSIVTNSDILALKQIYNPKNTSPLMRKIKIIALVVACVVGSLMLFLFFYRVAPFLLIDDDFVFIPIIFIVLILLIIIGIIYSIKADKKTWVQNVKLYRFAKANGLLFKPSLPRPGYNGMIFNIGDNRAANTVLNSQNKPIFEMANYTYSETHGSGKNRHTTYHYYGYIMIQLSKKLPHIVLDSKANNTSLFGANLSNLPESFDREQILSLEGDFNKYFTLYAPKEYERDALYVFSPDLMAMFVDQSSEFDAEIVDDKLFIYSSKHFDFSNIALVQQLFNIINKVGSLVVHNTDRYKDEMAASLPDNIVAESGRRLRVPNPAIIVLIIFIFIAFIIFIFNINNNF